MAKLPDEVSVAIALAEKAGWPVSARNDKIVIVAPDGVAITIGARPNDESLKAWRSVCRKYNLIEDGPAMTPEQQEEMAVTTATESESKSVPAPSKKEAEAAEAKRKALLAAAGRGPIPGAPKTSTVTVPVVTFKAPASPVVTPKVVATAVAAKKGVPAGLAVDEDGFPLFIPQMLVVEGDYVAYQLAYGKDKGRYFCPNCWERGEKATFKQPQGLASHRGFRHAAYTFPTGDGAPSVKLPEAIDTALELLRGALVEELSDNVDAEQVKDLTQTIEDLRKRLQDQDVVLNERGALLIQWEGKFRTVAQERDAAAKLAAERGTALDKAKAEYEAQVAMMLGKIEKDLQQFQNWANELAPVKFVGMVMNVVDKYLIK